MDLATGARLGHYEIVSRIGTGGMGAVYKAIDRRLDRAVAIKILKGVTPELRTRFEREGRVIASLQHPRICTLIDVGIHDGTDYLVMEYLEGKRLTCPQPLDKVIEYGAQIADALDAAHRKGIAHRDLKPDNIIVTENGVTLLDFGIAKVIGADTLTDTGVAIGTPAYMAPEQWRGEGSDTRTDIYALGCVLHEMATGERTWDAPARPARLDWIIKGCLARNPDDRWQSVRDVKRLLLAVGEREVEPAPPPTPRARATWWWTAAAALLGIAGIAAAWLLKPAPSPPLYTLSIAPPGTGSFLLSRRSEGGMALSPDGRMIAFPILTGGKVQLWVRRLDAIEAQPLPGTDGAFHPFWSPDSRWIAYFTPDRLMKVAATGGTPQVIGPGEPRAVGGAWGAGDVILFTGQLAGGVTIQRVAASGGTTAVLTPGTWPHFLPDGKRFLFTHQGGVWAASIDRAEAPRQVAANAMRPAYSNEHLLFVRGRMLVAQRMDPASLTISGDTVPIAELLPYDVNPGEFSVTPSGLLVFATGERLTALVWRDRTGKRLDELAGGAELATPRISPDGRRVVYARADGANTDIWIADARGGSATRLTFDQATDRWPIWSPDGASITYSSGTPPEFDLYRRAADGSGRAERLTQRPSPQHPMDWSTDNGVLLFTRNSVGLGTDLMVLPAGGSEYTFLQTKVSEAHSQIDPKTRRWIAYSSDDSGRREIYVQPFVPGQPASDARWQISTTGGTMPRWRADGGELYYWALDGRIMAATVDGSGTAFKWTTAAPLFQSLAPVLRINDINFDVTGDGQRFLMLEPADRAGSQPLHLVTDWMTAAKRGGP